jgi:hypothetical protein
MKNSECTITANLEIVSGTRRDYESLWQYHYLEIHLRAYAAIYVLRSAYCVPRKTNAEPIGVIVYAMPTAGCSMRSGAMSFLSGLDRRTRLNLLNKNVRTISRVIIEPRFRSLGLAARLVRETMPLMNVAFIEALAVMGQVNPFFEKAGMTRYDAPPTPACVRLLEAFDAVGIGEKDLNEPRLVQQKLDALSTDKTRFIECETALFLQCYGRRRLMQPGIKRTGFILNKLTDRPVYYLWQNRDVELRI